MRIIHLSLFVVSEWILLYDSLLHNYGNIATVGIMPYSDRMTWRALYSAQYHRQQCTLQAFEPFAALYMHNFDDKHPTRPGFEPSSS